MGTLAKPERGECERRQGKTDPDRNLIQAGHSTVRRNRQTRKTAAWGIYGGRRLDRKTQACQFGRLPVKAKALVGRATQRRKLKG